MDGASFFETWVTHLDVSGNCYIEKMRVGRKPRMLGFLRPDRVKIKPGKTRADDIFVYTIGQQERSIPREDIIHDKYPNPTNDFYGLAPIEPVLREIKIDLQMSDFTQAFFQNAGVPFGMLTVPYSVDEDEERAIRSRWKRAFQGVKGWFKLLIMNRDKAEYKQMGIVQKDMEMVATRELVEARICSAFGVPPVIVGALVGLKQGQSYANYDKAQHSFWSEEMQPLGGRIASRLTRDLLPDFMRPGESRASFAFDYTGVEALQEDNSEKLKVVAQLVSSGAFTPNSALGLLNLPTVADGDFFVRHATQLVEPALGSGKSGRVYVMPAPSPRLKSALGDALRRSFDLLLDKIGDDAERDLDQHFKDAALAVVARFLRDQPLSDERPSVPSPSAEDLLPKAVDEMLAAVVLKHAQAMIEATLEVVDELLPPPKSEPTDEAISQWVLARVGARMVEARTNPHFATRDAIREIIRLGDEHGFTVREMVEGVPAEGLPGLRGTVQELYKGRARAVARTELKMTQGWSASQRYRERGYTQVELQDGPACGFVSHDDPDAADGSIRSLDDYDAYPTAHPNAVLEGSTFVPYGGLDEMIRARYRGVAIRITSGDPVRPKVTTIGPNHPVLTRHGFVPAAKLKEGDEVIYDSRHDRPIGMSETNLEQAKPVEDIFQTVLAVSPHTRVPAARHDFHGDAVFCYGEVDIVRPQRKLTDVWDLGLVKETRQHVLVKTSAQAEAGASDGPTISNSERVRLSASRSVGGAGDGIDSAGHFALLPIRSIERVLFDGWAFDATTKDSLYCSDGLVVSNCVRTPIPVVDL
jgi:HK97 family phage portal protein